MCGVLAGCQADASHRAGSTEPGDPPETAEAVSSLLSKIPCQSPCDCPLGFNMCSEGTCFQEGFSPPPPSPLCGCSAQCGAGAACLAEQCTSGTLTASQNPVIVPAGQTTTTFTLSWTSQGAAQVDVWGEQNLQNANQKLLLGTAGPSGSALEPMSVGEVATLWLYAHNDTTTPLAILNMTGQH